MYFLYYLITWLIWISEVLCELSLSNYLVWILGYVDFDWSALELCDSEIDPKHVSVKPWSKIR